ncbi:hypothetical protein [Williamsia serinedens]|uniref:hypothetical protein n=1 Tax=Williamsia serinedens TaxID=391736 RepID=UPI0020A56703|nr:hypothetical protein [Williamsia serinedens]
MPTSPLTRAVRRCAVLVGVAAAVGGLIPADAGAAAAPADVLRQPFAATSIWNTPIGSDARYVPAGLPAVPRGSVWAPMPQDDGDHLIFTPDAPLVAVHANSAGWTGRSRCGTAGPILFSAPIPRDYVVRSSNENEGATFLLPDGRTMRYVAPLARCVAGGGATAQDVSAPVDLYGDGLSRRPGAAGLSGGPGGVLRVGELGPGSPTGPRHALRVIVDSPQVLFRCRTEPQCFRWPAATSDAGSVGGYGTIGDNRNIAMRMGALLAIPARTDLSRLGLETVPGRQLAWTMQNFGAYVADSTGGPSFGFVTERGPSGSFADRFRADNGFPFAQRVRDNTPWSRDVQRIMVALSVVDDNGPSSIGGGGVPITARAVLPGR